MFEKKENQSTGSYNNFLGALGELHVFWEAPGTIGFGCFFDHSDQLYLNAGLRESLPELVLGVAPVPMTDVLAASSIPSLREALRQVAQDQVPASIALRFNTRTSPHFAGVLNPLLREGQPVGAWATLAPEASESAPSSQFATIFNQPHVGIAFLTAAGDFLRVNDALARLLGYPHEKIRARSLSELCANGPQGIQDILHDLQHQVRPQASVREFLRHRDESHIPCELHFNAVHDQEG